MIKINLIITVFIISASTLLGQATLSFDEALARTLANNYDIRLSLVQEESAANNADKSAQGYMPSLNASGSYNWSYYGGLQRQVTTERNLDPNSSYAYTANAAISYVLFDGMGRKYRYQQAIGQRELSTLELKGIMESAVLDLSSNYYEVARLQLQSASLDSTFDISKQRLLRAEYGAEYGQSTALDILNAKVDLNTDSINMITSHQLESNAIRNLNLVMGEDIEATYEVVDDLQFSEVPTAELAIQSSLENGNLVERSRQIKDNAELNISSVRSDWYPDLGLNAGYDYRGSDDPNGVFLIGNRSFGPSAGVSLSWAIFDGTRKSRLANAKLGLESSTLLYEQAQLQAKAFSLNAQAAYLNALAVMRSSETNVKTAQDNFERSEESFKQGLINSIAYRQAQLNLLTAELQRNQSKFDAKNAELNLLALMGKLIAE